MVGAYKMKKMASLTALLLALSLSSSSFDCVQGFVSTTTSRHDGTALCYFTKRFDAFSDKLWSDRYPTQTSSTTTTTTSMSASQAWTPQPKINGATASKPPPFFAVEASSPNSKNTWSPSKVATRKSFTTTAQSEEQPLTPKLPANLSPQQAYFATRIQEARQRALMASLQSSSQQRAVQVLGRQPAKKDTPAPPKPSPATPPQPPLDPEQAARQAYFAQRIQQSRQRVLMENIATANRNKQTTTTMGRLSNAAKMSSSSSTSSATSSTKPTNTVTSTMTLERQQALLESIAQSAGTTTTTGAFFQGMGLKTIAEPTPPQTSSSSSSNSQSYFAQRIALSRQRALLANIAGSKGLTFTTGALQQGGKTADSKATHDANVIANTPAPMDAASVAARKAIFQQRIAASRQQANQRVADRTVGMTTTTSTVPNATPAPKRPMRDDKVTKESLIKAADETIQQAKMDLNAARNELRKELEALENETMTSSESSTPMSKWQPNGGATTASSSSKSPFNNISKPNIKDGEDTTKKSFAPFTPNKKQPLSSPFQAAAAAAQKATGTTPPKFAPNGKLPFTPNGKRPFTPNGKSSNSGPLPKPWSAGQGFAPSNKGGASKVAWSPMKAKTTAAAANETKKEASKETQPVENMTKASSSSSIGSNE